MQTDTRLLFIGFGIGIGIALIGGVVDFALSKRKRNPQRSNHLPGCIMYVAGALGLVGLVTIFISIILIGSVIPAIVLGAGVLSGFYAGFALLILLYLVASRIWSRMNR